MPPHPPGDPPSRRGQVIGRCLHAARSENNVPTPLRQANPPGPSQRLVPCRPNDVLPTGPTSPLLAFSLTFPRSPCNYAHVCRSRLRRVALVWVAPHW